MEKFDLNILGCGSATPTTKHLPSSQIVNSRDKLFMIDCGEGAQLQLRRMKQKFSRINHLFLTHLHGDHCFGLPGLLSTLGLLGRTGEFVIHAHPDAEKAFRPMLDFFCKEIPFNIRFNHIDPSKNEIIYEDRSLVISTIPLIHRMPCCGYLFKEKAKEVHIKSDMISFWNIPLKDIKDIKAGNDWIAPDGTIVRNNVLTRPAENPRSYACCMDTAYNEKIIPIIENVDLLFHEATFAEEDKIRAKQTCHSTGRDAAEIARKANVKKLVIGHFSARYDNDDIILQEAKEIFPNTVLANEGLTISI